MPAGAQPSIQPGAVPGGDAGVDAATDFATDLATDVATEMVTEVATDFWFANPAAVPGSGSANSAAVGDRSPSDASLGNGDAFAQVRAFHRALPGYAPTPLVDVPQLAVELGVARVLVKDESARFGLGAFKFLGASWAVVRSVARAIGYDAVPTSGIAGVRAALAGREPLELVTATDGNHGRAVAEVGRMLGLPVRIFVPRSVPAAVIDRMRGYRAGGGVAAARDAPRPGDASASGGAPVPGGAPASGDASASGGAPVPGGPRIEIVDADYDVAITRARAAAGSADGTLLVQDSSWDGYTDIPGWIVDGYTTLFAEIDEQMPHVAGPGDVISVPTGVGGLLQAAIAHYRSRATGSPPGILAVEPDTAACIQASLRAGEIRSVPTASTVMNGLNCPTPSLIAWPLIAAGLDAAVAVTDDEALAAVEALRAAGIATGPSGAASLAGIRAALAGPGAEQRRAQVGVTADSTVILINSEGFAEPPAGSTP